MANCKISHVQLYYETYVNIWMNLWKKNVGGSCIFPKKLNGSWYETYKELWQNHGNLNMYESSKCNLYTQREWHEFFFYVRYCLSCINLGASLTLRTEFDLTQKIKSVRLCLDVVIQARNRPFGIFWAEFTCLDGLGIVAWKSRAILSPILFRVMPA
jgi:hypothetical protein